MAVVHHSALESSASVRLIASRVGSSYPRCPTEILTAAIATRLIRVWDWAVSRGQVQGRDIVVAGATEDVVDDIAGLGPGVGQALTELGWMSRGGVFPGLAAKSQLAERDALVIDAPVQSSTAAGKLFALDDESPKSSGHCEASWIWEQWRMVPGVKACVRLTETRKKAARTRLADRWWKENYQQALAMICDGKAPFLQGKVRSAEGRTYQATIDWFLRPDSVAKILEGQYGTDGSEQQGERSGTLRIMDEVLG